MTIFLERVDSSLPDPVQCEWCGELNFEKLRVSFRVDPQPRFILFCTSCRAREADGQLDQFGRPIFGA